MTRYPSSMFMLIILLLGLSTPSLGARPNVVIVITDDQGYGDLSCHGNPVLTTPNIDALYAESVRLTDYHVSPTCSPTRAAFLTGHWSNRTGVWHTIMGRSMLREDETTLANVFADAGYATGMFGKWHLGDNYPFRAEDRGFQEVLRHGGGGIGQTPDYWDNAYFDGSYWHNGKPEPAKGYCTDVFFEAAKQFIAESQAENKPFLAYIASNAPHGPMHAPEAYAEPYAKVGNVGLQHFFGMIANIDDNVGKLRKYLDERGLTDNTIFIFTTDNGTSSGSKVHNAGMRGAKGSEYDGGHRVPFFVHWPDGKLGGGRDVKPLAAHVDVFPTLMDLCDIANESQLNFDGQSLAPLLRGDENSWPDRVLITDSQRVKDPIKWRKSSVMTSRWRLINGKELYDMQSDPGQQANVVAEHPDVVTRLTGVYDSWWDELLPTFSNDTAIYVGHSRDNPARLTSHDWITTGSTPWHQGHIRKGINSKSNLGHWNVKFVEAGEYTFRLRRWPAEVNAAIDAPLPPGSDVPGVRALRTEPGKVVPAAKATVTVGDLTKSVSVKSGDAEATIHLQVPAGKAKLTTTFETADGETYGAFYAYIEKR